MFIPVCMGYMQEKRVSREEASHRRRRTFHEQGALCLLSVLFALCALGAAICAVATRGQQPWTNVGVTTALVMVVIGATSMLVHPLIARCIIFTILRYFLYMAPVQADFLFWTDSK